MKYIDADKLIAEIKRLKYEYTAIDSHYGTVNANYVVENLEQLLSLIATLQQEQPEVDLEKEIEEQINIYYNECEKKLNQMSDDDTDISFLTLNNFARHFAEWGAIHLNARKK